LQLPLSARRDFSGFFKTVSADEVEKGRKHIWITMNFLRLTGYIGLD